MTYPSVRALTLALALAVSGCTDGSEPTSPRLIASVEVQPAQHTLSVGDEVALTATALDDKGAKVEGHVLAWSSSDEAVASITSAGRVKALGPGTVRIAATAAGKTGTAELTVRPAPVASIVVRPTAIVLEVGQTRVLTAITTDARGNVLEGRAISWSVDEPNASISATGVLIGQKAGYATVVASSEGKTFGVGVTVVSGEASAYELLYRRRDENDISDIMTLQLGTGAAPVVITAGLPSSHPTASPDGSRIAFAVWEFDALSERNELVSSIYAADRDGQNVRRLTRGSGSEDQPAWSPNGDRIAYRHVDSSGRADIWVMNADGSNSSNLTADLLVDANQHAPAWSPDGTRIAFASQQSLIEDVESSIWTMRADGTGKRLITSTATGFDSWPTWSPDGERIAFIRQYDLEGDITIVSAGGGIPVRLSLPGRQLTPAWSPDGEAIAFVQPGVGVLNVYTVRPNGRNVRLRTVEPAWGGGVEPTWIRTR